MSSAPMGKREGGRIAVKHWGVLCEEGTRKKLLCVVKAISTLSP